MTLIDKIDKTTPEISLPVENETTEQNDEKSAKWNMGQKGQELHATNKSCRSTTPYFILCFCA